MIIKIQGEQPFQVLSTNFTISASESGYDLYFSADGVNYSKLFTVAANTNRQVTQVAAGSYYYLEGNTDTVTVNWIANCYSGGDGGGSYTLPIASSDTLGGIKVGSGMTIAEDGTLSANPGGYTLPAATDSTLGGVKVGSGLTIDANGVLSVSGGTDGSKELVVSLEDLSGMSSSELKAAWDGIYAKYVSGYTVYVEGGVVNKNGYTVRIPLVEAIPETTPETHSGGWLYFGGIYGNNACYYLSFNSTGNISGNGPGLTNSKKFEAKTVYSLPTASTSTKGGVKVGSGLTIDSDKLSVNIGDGLAFSGNTIVVSGGTDGGPAVYYLDEMTQQERVALFNEIFQYDEFTFPAGNYRFFVTNRDNDEYQGRFELFVARFYDETPVSFSGVIQSRYNSTILQRGYELSSDGSFYKNFENNLNIGSVPSISSVSFGNDSRGGLIYDADNGHFIYDSNNVATGDTQNYCEDLIDYLFLTSLFTRNGRYENYYLINVHSLDVITGGTYYGYTAPTLSIRDITPYTIGDYTFQREVTFKYSDWVLRIDIPDVNIGANLRITQA